MSLTVEAVRRYDDAAPDSDATETATVALGYFWGPDARFGAMDGVVRTRVGYAGGTTPDPTYGSHRRRRNSTVTWRATTRPTPIFDID